MTGVFPSVLKDSKLDYSNYRPISLLSNIEEILENVSIGDYIPSLITNILSNDLQFGFTQYALINITENIRKGLDDGNIDCGVFVDLQKAFDTVDHQILLTVESLWDLWSFK